MCKRTGVVARPSPQARQNTIRLRGHKLTQLKGGDSERRKYFGLNNNWTPLPHLPGQSYSLPKKGASGLSEGDDT